MHYRTITTGCILFLLLSVSLPIESTPHFSKSTEIRVAVYNSEIKKIAEETKQAILYSWEENDTTYEIVPVIINKSDVVGKGKYALTNENFDVLVIPGSGRPYFDAYNPIWRRVVKKFVENGGGYVGICGGANLASMGFQEKFSPNTALSLSALRIANVYVNDQQMQEWQYLWKSNWNYGLPPIDVYIPECGNPIMRGFYDTYRSIRYGGGPGMYPADSTDERCGEVVPIAIYAEEPMNVAPLHYWKWNDGWKIKSNVTTDIKGQYAAVATTYGEGRIALFGPHPEKKTFFGGHTEEFPVRQNTIFTWFIYNWSDGISSEGDYNWWMLQRAVAWAGHAQIPHADRATITLGKPREAYADERENAEITIVIEKILLKAAWKMVGM